MYLLGLTLGKSLKNFLRGFESGTKSNLSFSFNLTAVDDFEKCPQGTMKRKLLKSGRSKVVNETEHKKMSRIQIGKIEANQNENFITGPSLQVASSSQL